MSRIVTLVLAAALLAGCNGGKMAQIEQKNKEIAKNGYAQMAAKNMDAFIKLLTPNFVDHNPEPGQKPGVEGVREAFDHMFAAFPDMTIQVDQLVAEGDLVTAKVTMTGTQDGPFHGMPASGKQFRIEGFDMLRLVDGKVSERWGVFDNLSMMMQLGAIPSPEETAKN